MNILPEITFSEINHNFLAVFQEISFTTIDSSHLLHWHNSVTGHELDCPKEQGWSVKETFVNNYLHIFINFAKSIDFTYLQ